MNIVDGKSLATAIADRVKAEIVSRSLQLKLSVIACDPNFETKKFLALKQNKAEGLGIKMDTIILPKETTTEEIITVIKNEAKTSNGIVVQLPLPDHIDVDRVLAAIPRELDIDVFGYSGEDTEVLPPVVGAIAEIADYYQLDWRGKQVVVFGAGRLVGLPASLFARAKGANVIVINEHSTDIETVVGQADIIILGAGKPNLLTPEMVKAGVVVFDAGASEDGGLLVGDASAEVANKAAIFTPVPGGIGPMTISILFCNLLKLSSRQ